MVTFIKLHQIKSPVVQIELISGYMDCLSESEELSFPWLCFLCVWLATLLFFTLRSLFVGKSHLTSTSIATGHSALF